MNLSQIIIMQTAAAVKKHQLHLKKLRQLLGARSSENRIMNGKMQV